MGFPYLRVWMSYQWVDVKGLSKPGFILTYKFNGLPTIEDRDFKLNFWLGISSVPDRQEGRNLMS